MKEVMKTQIGGNHYKDCPIQPIEYALANHFNYWESMALKYLSRHRTKNGRQDLEKLIHCIQLGIEAEYPQAEKHEPGKPC